MNQNYLEQQKARPSLKQMDVTDPTKLIKRTFDLKLNKFCCDKVYIRYECQNGNDSQEQEMQIFKELDDSVQYQIKLLLLQKGIYKYQYIKVKNDQKEKEQQFRTFKEWSGENLIDEWNKVWCLYRVESINNILFKQYEISIEREGQTALTFKNTKASILTWDCKELLDNDTTKKLRKFVFQNRENNEIIKSEEFSATNGQSYYLNQIYWEFQKNDLFSNQNMQKLKREISSSQSHQSATIYMSETKLRQQVKELRTELDQKEKQYHELINQNEQLKFQIAEVNDKMENEKKNFNQNLLLEKETNERSLRELNEQFSEKIEKIIRDKDDQLQQKNQQLIQFKNEISQLEQQLCEKMANTSFEQNEVNAAIIKDLDNNNKIFESEIILNSYQALKDSVEQLEREKQESIFQIQKSEQKAQIYKIQIQNLQNLTKNCNSKLEAYMQQIQRFEEEQRHHLLKNQKYNQVITIIKQQLNQSQQELEKYKNSLTEIQSQLLKVEEKNQELLQLIEENEQQIKASKLLFDNLKTESEKQLKSIIEKNGEEKECLKQEILKQETLKQEILRQEILKQEILKQEMEQQKLRGQQLLNFMKNNLKLLEKCVELNKNYLIETQKFEIRKKQDTEMFHLFKEKLEQLMNVLHYKSSYAFPNQKYMQQMENQKIQLLNCKKLLLAYLQETTNENAPNNIHVQQKRTEYQKTIQKLKSSIGIILSFQIGDENKEELKHYFQQINQRDVFSDDSEISEESSEEEQSNQNIIES